MNLSPTVEYEILAMFNSGWRPTATGLRLMKPAKRHAWLMLISAEDGYPFQATSAQQGGGR